MRNRGFVFLAVLGCVLIAAPLLAQNPTGTITGRVLQDEGPLPGVTITATSPSMQGQKVAISGADGEYIFVFLPPGQYTVTYALDGFKTLEMPVVVSVAQTKTVDAKMYIEAIREEITVTGNYETVSVGTQSNVTMQADLIESLPVARTMNSAVLLTPGTFSTGPNNGITISGAQSYENLFLVNGVVVNENLRGQPFTLYIEDAVEETTTSASGVSAQYGRFSGGVVNMITKSGGNQFSGSVRASLTNDSWNGKTPLTTSQEDKINTVYEGTFGGYAVKDHLWFFLAARDLALDTARQFYDLTPYTYSNEERRYEGKLTWSPHASHRIIGSYMMVDNKQFNYTFRVPMEPSVIDEMRDLPQELLALNYTGVLTESFFIEGQYSERKFTFGDSGGNGFGDRINGTEIVVYGYGGAGAGTFCGDCGDEERNMDNWLVKGSLFLSGSTGTHDLVMGVDSYNDQRLSNNYQTPSNYRIYIYDGPAYDDAGVFYPVFGAYNEIDYWPIFKLAATTSYKTNSAYANDTWRLGSNWTFNVGLRYDKNDGVDGSGAVVAQDSRFSPRLGASWDIKGDGDWVINASAARYVQAIANSVASSGGAGVPSWLGYEYGGPFINTDGVNQCGPDHPELCMYTISPSHGDRLRLVRFGRRSRQYRPVVFPTFDQRRQPGGCKPRFALRRRVLDRFQQTSGQQGHDSRRLREPRVPRLLRHSARPLNRYGQLARRYCPRSPDLRRVRPRLCRERGQPAQSFVQWHSHRVPVPLQRQAADRRHVFAVGSQRQLRR